MKKHFDFSSFGMLINTRSRQKQTGGELDMS